MQAAHQTFEDVGMALGKSGAYVKEVFCGQREPTTEDLRQLAETLKVPIRILNFVFLLGRGWQISDW